MEKPVIREHMIQTLKKMPSKQKQQKETVILQLLFSSQLWQTAKSVGVIRSLPFEFDTAAIFAKGFEQNKRIAVPKAQQKNCSFIMWSRQRVMKRRHLGLKSRSVSKKPITWIYSLFPAWLFRKKAIASALAAAIMIVSCLLLMARPFLWSSENNSTINGHQMYSTFQSIKSIRIRLFARKGARQ